jgi:2,5-diamino-6-(ribosylamino)-4(3H)-pyrimidinone 5'-phosphate reductase
MNRPHVLINVAMAADGKIDSITRKGAQLSSIADKARVDRLRADVDAILVGGRTLLAEDPRLTVKSLALREERKALGLPENPAKVGVISEIPSGGANFMIAQTEEGTLSGTSPALPLQQFLSTGSARKLIYTTSRTAPEEIARLKDAGAEVFILGAERVDLAAMLESLYSLGIRKLLVEGGGTIIAEFFCLGLVDEFTIYIAPKIFCGASAPTPADGAGLLPEQAPGLKLVSVEKFDTEGGVLLHYRI